MSEALVSIKKLSKRFGKEQTLALDAIDAEIPKGEIIGLVGPDGAGKTTLIRHLAALLLPTTGSVEMCGKTTKQCPELFHQTTGYMPQKFGLYEDLTVQQNLDLYADLRHVENEERDATFERLLSFTNLGSFTDRLAGKLSGGMKQKLGLACTLVKKPNLLLLDEPSVGVDPLSRKELWKMIDDLLKQNISILWSTAYLDEAERCNSVLLLSRGKLEYAGSPKGLTERIAKRVFKAPCPDDKRRAILKDVLRSPNVSDASLQGKEIRIVFKNNAPLDLERVDLPLEATAPRFEDAFIELLGGGPKGESALAKQSPPHEKIDHPPVEAKDLVKRFGTFPAVDQISFSVKHGEIFGLLGPNGAGKSTTFKMLCGLLKPSNGSALVNHFDVQKTPAIARAQIGYMAQKFSLYGLLSVEQNLEFFSGIYNLRGAKQREAIDQMIDIFSLAPFLNQSAGALPLGYKQRLSLACATMHQPPVLFLDEPTSGVDPQVRREFWNHINGLVEKGVTVLISTHFMDEAQYCDRIALIYRGKIAKLDTPDALRESTRSKTLEDAFIQIIEDYGREYHV